MDLNQIKDPKFLKSLSKKELKALALEIRSFIIESVSKTGGHLSSNLGVIELTIALHYVFNELNDSIIFDVGHQSYTHKILTGRAKYFDSLRKKDGLSGFTSYDESPYDKWESGHAGTAISALSAKLISNEKMGNDGHVIAVVGDASIVNGTSFEALNLLGNARNKNAIIVLNDNKMSISKPVGGFSSFVNKTRGTKFVVGLRKFLQFIFPKFIHRFFSRLKRAIKGFFQLTNIFEDLGYMYMGPYDGHDIKSLILVLEKAKSMNRPVVLHVLTEKGHGYLPAEENPSDFHGTAPFDIKTGKQIANSKTSYSKIIAKIITKLHEQEKIFVVMPAMTVGSHFDEFSNLNPDYFLDVGIAEEHAASLSAALAHDKIKVFLPFYSTFSQRAYDQILNDIARSNHHVVIGIDRAGFVPEDGSTHQGIYDISMFKNMPNVVIATPYDINEAANLLYFAFFKQNNPFVIRYPKESVDNFDENEIKFNDTDLSYTYLHEGKDINIISYGRGLDLILEVVNENNISANVINAKVIRPLDEEAIKKIASNGRPILVYEEAFLAPLYLDILKYMNEADLQTTIKSMSITNGIIGIGNYQELLEMNGLDKKSVLTEIKKLL